MTHNEEGETDLCVEPNHHPPYEVMEHSVILVLPHTIVRMKVDMCLSQSMLLEEMVEHADDGVGPLPRIAGFINEVVDLPWNGFTTYPKDSALARGEEVDWARLEGVRGIVNLLCHVKGVVDDRGQGARRELGGGWRRREHASLLKGLPHGLFGLVAHFAIV